MDKTKILITNGSLMQGKSIAECPPWSILQYFCPALSDNWSWKPIYGLFESGRFTQVFLYSTVLESSHIRKFGISSHVFTGWFSLFVLSQVLTVLYMTCCKMKEMFYMHVCSQCLSSTNSTNEWLTFNDDWNFTKQKIECFDAASVRPLLGAHKACSSFLSIQWLAKNTCFIVISDFDVS